MSRKIEALLGLLLMAGCFQQVLAPGVCTDKNDCQTGYYCDSYSGACRLPQMTTLTDRPQNNLDVLFLIDSSPSMSPKQQALALAIPTFIKKIEASGANYQVGVATADIGSWVAPNKPWSVTLGTCNSFAGDDGVLQRVACSTRSGLTQTAAAACQALCPDPQFVPAGNVGFIRKANGVTNVPKLLDPITGQDLGPQRAFQCIALIGDNGCGLEGTLEGARRALDGHLAANDGFLRYGSVLAVIIITDEDDCSVSLAGRKENDPTTSNCAVGNADAGPECFNPDFRCQARSTLCDQPLNTAGEKTNCRERPQSYLEPVATYVDFFTKLRPASKLLIGGIYTVPPLPAARLVVSYERNGSNSFELNRGTGADAACVSAADPTVVGRPQHRLSRFTQSFPGAIEVNVCSTGSYASALDKIASAIKTKLSAQCLPKVPKQVSSAGRVVPACVVGDVSEARPTEAPAQPFPSCSDACCSAWARGGMSGTPTADDLEIAAVCANEGVAACFCAVAPTGTAAAQGICPGQAISGIIRQGGPDSAPPGTIVSFSCELP